MNDASFILTPARYLVQIACERGWKTVAYLNDLERKLGVQWKMCPICVCLIHGRTLEFNYATVQSFTAW